MYHFLTELAYAYSKKPKLEKKATPCSDWIVKPLKLGVRDTIANVIAEITPEVGEKSFLL